MDVTFMTQKDKLGILEASLTKHRILTAEEICKILGVSSRMSSHRYLKQLDCLTSYSHGGRYYALRKTAEFDLIGLWHCGDVSFSKHGTLLETIVHLVANSEAGKTSDELAEHCRLRVQNALLQLVKKEKLFRQKLENMYLYTSVDGVNGKQQLAERIAQTKEDSLPDWIEIDVLVEIIRASREIIRADKIALSLHKRGSSISLSQVQQVFRRHSLEKKTLDSAH